MLATREFDSPWKDALDLYLEWVLRWFAPELHEAIDWSKGYESLDAELQQIVREAELGPARADKLFRVYLRDGSDVWLLIHVEVQSQPDPDFARRMFTYYYRLVDRYNRDVVSLAILGDDRPDWRPTEYVRERFGCKMVFSFRTVKLLEWADRREELANSEDPIALFVLAHLESLLTHGKPELRVDAKWRLIRHLLGLGWTPEQIRQLYRLIDWLLELPEELEQQLDQNLYRYAEEKHMPFVPHIERKSREEGKREELLEAVQAALETKFGDAGMALVRDLPLTLDLDKLRQIHRVAIRASTTIDDLRALIQ